MEQKPNNKKELVHNFATDVAEGAKEKAKAASGWKKWLYVALAIIAGAAAWFTTGCTQLTPAQVQGVKAAVKAYHEAITVKPTK